MADLQAVPRTPSPSDDIQQVESVVTADLTKGTQPPSTPMRAPIPRRASRPPPPPIFVRSATDRGDLPQVEIVDDDKHDAEEEADGVGELPMTPNRSNRMSLTFDRPSSPRDRPNSPSWAPMDTPSDTPLRSQRSPRPNSWHRNSLEVPSFYKPPSPSPSHESFDNGHQHVHARNLSIYFPQPGVPLPPRSPSNDAGESVIPEANNSAFGGAADWGAQDMGSPDTRSKRRGHHHKHSLSHNFFSFLDPTQTNGTLAPAVNLSSADDKPHPVPVNVDASPSTTTMLSPLPSTTRDPQAQLLGSFAVIEAVLGAALWVEGQISGWRSLTAVGYLIVFDALGLGVNLLARKDKLGWRSLRRPYGSSRFTSLLCFAQSVFLGFAAVYIAKEALEQVVLGNGAHDHGGHGHGHGEHTGGDERPFPVLFLFLATAASAFSGAFLWNHSRLVDATGAMFLPPGLLSLPIVAKHNVLRNPFTLSISGVAAVLAVAAVVVPIDSLKSFDAMASLGLTILTGALAYPPTLAFGHVLLQTAPPASTLQMKALRKALRDVADDSRILGLGTLRVWAIDAGKVGPDANVPASAPTSRRPSISTISPSTEAFTSSPQPSSNNIITLGSLAASDNTVSTLHVPLVVTLIVHVHHDATDSDIMEITRTAWSKLSIAVGHGRGGEGEVTVSVKRGWEGAE